MPGRALNRISLQESIDIRASFLWSKYLQTFCFTPFSTTIYSGTVTVNLGTAYECMKQGRNRDKKARKRTSNESKNLHHIP